MPPPLTLSQISSSPWEAANILRGPVDAADFKSDVFPLLFFKRLSDALLLEAIHHVEETRGDLHTLWAKLYSQDKTARQQRRFGLAQRARRVRQQGKPPKQKNLTTSAIARMNLFLNGADDFLIVRGDTLRSPAIFSGDNLANFNCVVVCRTQKPKARRGKILFTNAVNEVTRERAQSFLTDEHLQRVVRAYQDFKDEPGFTRVVPIEEIRAKEGNLSIPLYVGGETQAQSVAAIETATTALPNALAAWLKSSRELQTSINYLLQTPRNPKHFNSLNL